MGRVPFQNGYLCRSLMRLNIRSGWLILRYKVDRQLVRLTRTWDNIFPKSLRRMLRCKEPYCLDSYPVREHSVELQMFGTHPSHTEWGVTGMNWIHIHTHTHTHYHTNKHTHIVPRT